MDHPTPKDPNKKYGLPEDIPGMKWESWERSEGDWEDFFKKSALELSTIDKTVPKFKRDFSYWSGSEHYKTGAAEPIDLAYSGGFLLEAVKWVVIKYCFRLKRGRDKPKNKEDILKACHYLAMLYETLD